MSILGRASRRHLLRHPWQLALSVLGVAIAVAVVVGIDLANTSASRAFELSVEGVAGRATHEITAGPGGVDEALYTDLRLAGWRSTAPVVEAWVLCPAVPRPLRLFGVDPFAEDLFRTFTRRLAAGASSAERTGEQTGELGPFLTEPGAVLTTGELARELGVAVGERFEVQVAGRSHRLTLIGVLDPPDELARRSGRDLLVVDLASAQEILGQVGRLSRIDLVLDGGRDGDGDAELLRRALPPGVELTAKASRSDALEQMTRAFRLNLQALALLALLVGMFLIYNTMTFSVVERRALIGTLRALGVTRREVFALVLGEAALTAALGSLAGAGLGILLARGLLDLVVRTINDLYFVLSVSAPELSPAGFAKGLGLGIVGTLLAAARPAWEATRTAPRAVLLRSLLERRARRALPVLAAAGLLLGGAALALLALPSRSLGVSFAAVFLVTLGAACLVPPATWLAARALGPPMAGAFGILGSLAARGVAATLSRTGVAVAALVVAVAMTIGVGVMVRSFRATLISWLDVTLQADFYLAPVDVGSRGGGRVLDPAVVEAVRRTPGVAHATTYRRVTVGSPDGPTRLTVLELAASAFRIFPLADGLDDRAEEVWQRFVDGAVIVSEPLAFHRGLAAGDRIELRTDRGPRHFEIAAVFYDYATDRGVVALHRQVYDRFWDDPVVQTMGVWAAPGSDPEALARALEGAAAGHQEVTVAANRALRRGALEIFDRTFVITGVLRLLALLVAFIGVLSALMALQLERARELGVLRANGLTPGQVWGLVTAQTGLLGAIAGTLSIPVGLVMAWMLIHVINRRSFGWTLRMEVAPEVLVQALALAFVAAVLAGLWPAWRMSRSSPAWALREE